MTTDTEVPTPELAPILNEPEPAPILPAPAPWLSASERRRAQRAAERSADEQEVHAVQLQLHAELDAIVSARLEAAAIAARDDRPRLVKLLHETEWNEYIEDGLNPEKVREVRAMIERLIHRIDDTPRQLKRALAAIDALTIADLHSDSHDWDSTPTPVAAIRKDVHGVRVPTHHESVVHAEEAIAKLDAAERAPRPSRRGAIEFFHEQRHAYSRSLPQ